VRLSGGVEPRRAVELARAAEASGFFSLWFAENAFERGVLPAAAACAAATARIGIGIGVFNPHTRHPALMAMEIGALDELAQGRVRLGIGSGVAAATERLGLPTDRPLAAVRDTIAIVRGLLAGEEVSYAGPMFSAHDIRLGYRPPRRDLPLYMAARGEQAVTLAARVADGLLVSNMCPAEFTRWAVATMHAAARKAGHRPLAEVVQYVPCIARPDRGEAIDAAKEMLAAMLPPYWSLAQRVPAAKAALLRAAELREADLAAAVGRLRGGTPAAQALDERFVAAFAIAGTGEDCLAQARRYRSAGASELALSFAGTQPEADMACLAAAARTA
jgi:5,10-methylenetetrahydromethanopterin reductase